MKSKKEILLLIASLGCRMSYLILKYFFSLVVILGIIVLLAFAISSYSIENEGLDYDCNFIVNFVLNIQLIGYAGLFIVWGTKSQESIFLNSLPGSLIEEIYQERVGERMVIMEIIKAWGLTAVSILVSLLVHSYIIIWGFSKGECILYMLIYCVVVVITYFVCCFCCNFFNYSWKELSFIDNKYYRKIKISTIQKYLEANHWRPVETKENGTYEYRHPCYPEGKEVIIPQIEEHEAYYNLISSMLFVLQLQRDTYETKPIQTYPTRKGVKFFFKKRTPPVSVLAEIIKLEKELDKEIESV